MKHILIIFLSGFSFLGFSQDIDFKKGIISVDGKECMKYDSDANTVTYQNLNGDDIMILKYMRPVSYTHLDVYKRQVLMSLIALMFIFKSWLGSSLSFLLSFAISSIEILVAWLQAYIFTMWAALFFGAAVEEHHHEEAHH